MSGSRRGKPWEREAKRQVQAAGITVRAAGPRACTERSSTATLPEVACVRAIERTLCSATVNGGWRNDMERLRRFVGWFARTSRRPVGRIIRRAVVPLAGLRRVPAGGRPALAVVGAGCTEVSVHQQLAPPVCWRKTAVKTCPSCWQRMPGYYLGTVHIVRECELVPRSQRKVNHDFQAGGTL